MKGFGGEFGHIASDPNGPVCDCGNRGCVETRVSAWALVRKAQEAISQGLRSELWNLSNGDPQTVSVELIAQAAESGETENDIAVAPCLQYGEEKRDQIIDNKEASMKFAVPTNQGKLCAHFGHCEAFALIDIDTAGAIINETYVTPPPHEPGLLPDWLSQKGVNCVIAGGMGSRAQQLFAQKGIRVVTGAMGEHPQEIVEHHLKGTLQMGANTCDH